MDSDSGEHIRFSLVSDSVSEQGATLDDVVKVVVRHEIPAWFMFLIAVSMLCIGVLSGVVISHHSDISRLRDDVTLNDVWIKTHKHEEEGAVVTHE